MKKRVSEATPEEILHDVCYHEDPDSSLLINTTEDGRVFISNQTWSVAVTDDSFRGALIRFQVKRWNDLQYNRGQVKEIVDKHYTLDWDSVICKIKTPTSDQA